MRVGDMVGNLKVAESEPAMIALRHKDFDGSLQRQFRLGGKRKKRAEKVSGILEQVRFGVERIKGVPVTNHGENRIRNCVKYDLGDGYRLITAQSQKVILFLFFGDHDECDRWLNRNSGIELSYNKVEKTWGIHYATSPGDGTVITRPAIPSEASLLERLSGKLNEELLDGVPPIAAIKISRLSGSVTTSEIEAVCDGIPDEERKTLVYDVLVLLGNDDRDDAENRLDLFAGRAVLAEGQPDAEILSVKDGDTVRRLVVGSEEYREWLNKLAEGGEHLEWILFMHPEQEQVVEEDFSGAAQLSGVSGSGKTCIAVRRAIRLAQADTEKRVLVVTLNRSLAGLIEKLVDAATPDLGVRSRIHVSSFFELCQELLQEFEPHRVKYYDSVSWKLGEHIDEVFREYYRCWTNAHTAHVLQPIHMSLMAQGISAENYLREEFDWLRSALNDKDRSNYRSAADVPRVGRRYPIQEGWRKLILKGMRGWEEKMDAVGVIDYLGLTTAVSRHSSKVEQRFTNAIVDEAQDFGTTELAIIRQLVPDGENDIFLCGDIAQHVLPKHRMLSKAGIVIGNRSRQIIRNYRNTRQILEAAYHVLIQNLHEEMMDRAEKDLELLDPKFANRSSNEPLVLHATDLGEEIGYARSNVEAYLELHPHAKCCIVIAGYTLSEVETFGNRLGIKVLDGTHDPFSSSIVLSDLEETKGYEFDFVAIVNCCEGVLPRSDAPREEAYRDGCRLYVAMTRAKNDLFISYHGSPSEWLENAREKLAFYDWSEVEVLNPEYVVERPAYIAEVEDNKVTDELELNGRQFCFTKRALGLSLEAQAKLCELVDGRGRRLSNGVRVKWANVRDILEDIEREPRVRRLVGPTTSTEIRERLSQ